MITGLSISSSSSARSAIVGQRGQGDENAVGIASLGVKAFGDFVRGMNRKIGELGVFSDAVTGNLQDLESRSFEMAFESLIDLIFIRCADHELLTFIAFNASTSAVSPAATGTPNFSVSFFSISRSVPKGSRVNSGEPLKIIESQLLSTRS